MRTDEGRGEAPMSLSSSATKHWGEGALSTPVLRSGAWLGQRSVNAMTRMGVKALETDQGPGRDGVASGNGKAILILLPSHSSAGQALAGWSQMTTD